MSVLLSFYMRRIKARLLASGKPEKGPLRSRKIRRDKAMHGKSPEFEEREDQSPHNYGPD